MIVVLGLPLNLAAIILGCIFSMLLSVFNALGPKWYTPTDPAYGQAKAGQLARTYIQQLCEDTGCSPEDW